MTDTTTIDERPQEGERPELHESAALGAEGRGAQEPLKDRFVLPLLLPLLSMAAVGLLAINISRILLAGDEDSALAIGITLLLAILIGATIIAAMPRAKTSSLTVVVALAFFVVAMAGLVALGPSLDDGTGGTAAGYVEPTGAATSTVSVTAGPGLSFDGITAAPWFNQTVAKGVVQIDYGGASGHTLAIQDPKFDGFLLGTDAGAKKSGKVDLTPGTYTIYCTVPGHEQAGMHGTITVTG